MTCKIDQTDISETVIADCLASWSKVAKEYSELVSNEGRDSYYLRSQGLKPNLLSIIGDCSKLRLLDIGCGNGWLLDDAKPAEGYGCDIAEHADIASKWNFQVQDVRELSYTDNFFDVTVASLVLIWFRELDVALREMYRVTKPGGKMVIAMVHPYFYRMGQPEVNGDLTIRRDLSKSFKIEGLKIGGIAGPLTYHYHPYTDYLNGCIKAGFRICKVLDWFLDMEDYLKNIKSGMHSSIARTGKVPTYSFVECEKI